MDNNYLATINALSRIKSDNLVNKSTNTASSANLGANFQKMLLEMMMLSSLGNTSSDDSSSSGDLLGSSGASSDLLNSGSSSGMDPNIFSLMQQLLLQQLTRTSTNSATPAAPATSQPADLALLDLASQSGVGFNPLNSAAPVSTSLDPTKSTPEGRPVGGVLTQGFHSTHKALDFGVPLGTPVKATMNGKVVYAGWNNEGYGNLVIVENGPYKTYFAHLSKIPVSLGQQVQAGSIVGISGSTGNSTGPHVHYEVRFNGVAIDPTSFTLKK
jgi:murein DD-endopeptidase MepM/ murein hydrolase activator NlpD